jgi:glycerol-3-phosphate dehydrogenase (NAD+)
MGAKPTTLSGLSGSGDIMLTCFFNLSRNRNVGLRLGSGEKLDEIMSSMNQVCSILSMTSIYAQYMTCMIQYILLSLGC